MTRKLSPAERLAAAHRDGLLDSIVERADRISTWDRFLVEQFVYTIGLQQDEFSANDARDLLPELGHGYLGAAFNSLRAGGVIEHTGTYVPSTQASTHGHRIAQWRLSIKGLLIAQQRRAAVIQPERAA